MFVVDDIIFLSYYRLHHLKQEISFVIPGKETFGDESEQYVFSGRIEKKLEFLVEMCSKATEVENDAEELHQLIRTVSSCCHELLEILDDLKLPIVRPRWCDLTDAGPGVGVSNFKVKFRDAEFVSCLQIGSSYSSSPIKRGQRSK